MTETKEPADKTGAAGRASKPGTLRMQNVAPKLSETPGSIRSPSPEPGQHSEEVYRDLLGYDAARLADLRARGII